MWNVLPRNHVNQTMFIDVIQYKNVIFWMKRGLVDSDWKLDGNFVCHLSQKA